ncbi:MAG: molybdopterin-dependent oxidoreductase [Terriglobales bacterium]
MTINRRFFLQVAAGGALGVATSGATMRDISTMNAALEHGEETRVPGGPETWATATCSLCASGCGLRVRKIGKRAVKIQGNPVHPVSHGGLCPKGLAGLQQLYHPDRLRAPMKNVGSRENPRWKDISWDEALGTLVAKLRELRAAGQPHTAVLIDRDSRNLLGRLLRRFMFAYGSPNYLNMPSGLDSLQSALYLQQGVTQPVAYDFDNSQYVASFGVNLLEGWGSPVAIMRSFGRWRQANNGRRAKFVQIEPRLSVTAARADEWVPIRPGTEAALALGIAYVLISEGLYDANFVRERTFGFDDWHDAQGKSHLGFRSLVLTEYRLNDVANITGVPAETILRLGREFGHNRPAVAIGDHQTSTLPGNPSAAMAVHSLNAMMGSLDVPGGVLLQQEPPGSSDDQLRERIREARVDSAPDHLFPAHHLSRLPQAIMSQRPYAVRALLLHQSNPVFEQPNGEAFAQAFRQVPFIASFTTFMDESSATADLILPACTFLEKWNDAAAPPTFGNAVQSISAPVLPARHGSRDPGDVFLFMAQKLGGPLAAAFPYASFEDYLKNQVKEIFATQSGAVFSSTLEETWNRLLERSGWRAPTYSNADELWTQMQEQGGWWEPSYYYGEWGRVAQTRSGRFEFYSQALAEWSTKHSEAAQLTGIKLNDDRSFLPHQPAVKPPPKDYPLVLMPVEVLPFARGEGAHLPYLQQIAGLQLFEKWDSWMEINPETAKKLGVSDNDYVWIESKRGRAKVRARLYQGVHPDAVHLPLGYGHTAGSAWACRGVNPLTLIEEQLDPVSGLPQTATTYVKVYRA